MIKPYSEQDLASMDGPRAMKEPGQPMWCWQTISALQHMWKNLNLNFEQYMSIWAEAEEHRVWEKVPYEKPFGTKENMVKELELGDDAAARTRVAVQAMPGSGTKTKSDYLTARIARDRPDVLQRMQRGEFTSVARAAREAGIFVSNPKKVTLGKNIDRVAETLKGHYSEEELEQIKERL